MEASLASSMRPSSNSLSSACSLGTRHADAHGAMPHTATFRQSSSFARGELRELGASSSPRLPNIALLRAQNRQSRRPSLTSRRKHGSKSIIPGRSRIASPLKKNRCSLCDEIASPVDAQDPRASEFQLNASSTSEGDPNPITLPIYSVDGYNEWHHSSHVLDGRLLVPAEPTTTLESNATAEDSQPRISVPVLTKEEQLELAATPAHPAALTALYWSHGLNCLAEHSWRFLSPATISVLHHSLLPVACASFVGQLIIFVGAPWVGHFMDSTPRVTAFNTLSIVQTTAMVLSALATVYGLQNPPPGSLSGGAILRQPWFLVVMAAGAVDKLTGLASGVAFERDWVILLAGQNRPIALASANAILRRVDLFCELAGPISFGWLLSNFQPFFCLNISMALCLVSLPILLFLVHTTDRLSSGALGRPREAGGPGASSTTTTSTTERSPETSQNQKNGEQQGGQAQGSERDSCTGPLDAIVSGWRSFLRQSVLPASLAYVLLYFNAVLSPGSLMTSFLTQRGVDVSVIGAFRGACAAMGFAATFVSAPLVARLGLLNAGASALIFQTLLLAASVAVFFASKSHQTGLLMLFLALVVLSRLGHWVYDVVDAQIFQTAVPSSEANLVGTTEIALASLAELFMLGTAIVLHDVSRFGQLAMLSMASVAGATLIYCAWLAHPDPKRNAMFPKRPEWAFGRDDGGDSEGEGGAGGGADASFGSSKELLGVKMS